MKQFLFIGLLLVVGLSACKKDRITANGNIITEHRDLGAFNGIRSSGSTPVKVFYGDEFKVLVKGSSNLIPYFETRVVGTTLYLGFENINISRDDIEVEVTLPAIQKIELSGSGDVNIINTFPVLQNLAVRLSGSGKVEALSSMAVVQAHITISGSGNVNLEPLSALEADLTISGSGNAKLQVQQQLKATISGSGKVYYRGNPSLQQEISGSGKVIKF
ncbi:head GIN domain-containing protein [Pedobacter sp.]